MKYLCFFIVALFLVSGCVYEVQNAPGKPLIAIDFNGDITNVGLSQVDFRGDKNVSYHFEENDTSLDLSANARFRKPLIIDNHEAFSLNDYEAFTYSIWVKKALGDPEPYTILSQQKVMNDKIVGWELGAEENGAWSWNLKDTLNAWEYKPTVARQPVNDGDWHHLVFAYNQLNQEARLYYDGRNVAVYSLVGIELEIDKVPLNIGLSKTSSDPMFDVFNGQIDDFGLWSRGLSDQEVYQLYRTRGKRKYKSNTLGESIKVMSWNIWNGGIHEGKYVGIERVAKVIESSGADVVLLQEVDHSGVKIADALGYFYYSRSNNLGVLSRFPFGETKNVFRPSNFGCVEIMLNNTESFYACPVLLSNQPNTEVYIKSGEAVVDTIVSREMETRGKEVKFILSELRQMMSESSNKPILLGGTFNSGSHLDWTARNHDNYFGYTVPFPVTKQIEAVGFIDTYRFLYPDEVEHLGQTWSPRYKTALQNRIDYIYVRGNKLNPTASYVIEDHLLSFPSDHSAVLSEFIWKKKVKSK
ncbi:endonuclease/exonuclease/phosphatase family protein [Carboxylicivirga sp. N1Y90]|uniref:endonuclease/exonuclease/phosphatase family protein n=1 Tax=Carboxylicivirga fragile TaxID=3417571 RepID=UPI003D34092F|nr:endonuclease/exonuclease/phosphatase family protein [Marinilabiliaceae bacterium N1Y90]